MTLKNNLYTIINLDSEDLTATVELNPECFIYKVHFPELPITPGVCIIQMATELFEELTQKHVQVEAVMNAKFLAVINPQSTTRLKYTFSKVAYADDGSACKVSVVVADSNTVFTKLSMRYNIK